MQSGQPKSKHKKAAQSSNNIPTSEKALSNSSDRNLKGGDDPTAPVDCDKEISGAEKGTFDDDNPTQSNYVVPEENLNDEEFKLIYNVSSDELYISDVEVPKDLEDEEFKLVYNVSSDELYISDVEDPKDLKISREYIFAHIGYPSVQSDNLFGIHNEGDVTNKKDVSPSEIEVSPSDDNSEDVKLEEYITDFDDKEEVLSADKDLDYYLRDGQFNLETFISDFKKMENKIDKEIAKNPKAFENCSNNSEGDITSTNDQQDLNQGKVQLSSTANNILSNTAGTNIDTQGTISTLDYYAALSMIIHYMNPVHSHVANIYPIIESCLYNAVADLKLELNEEFCKEFCNILINGIKNGEMVSNSNVNDAIRRAIYKTMPHKIMGYSNQQLQQNSSSTTQPLTNNQHMPNAAGINDTTHTAVNRLAPQPSSTQILDTFSSANAKAGNDTNTSQDFKPSETHDNSSKQRDEQGAISILNHIEAVRMIVRGIATVHSYVAINRYKIFTFIIIDRCLLQALTDLRFELNIEFCKTLIDEINQVPSVPGTLTESNIYESIKRANDKISKTINYQNKNSTDVNNTNNNNSAPQTLASNQHMPNAAGMNDTTPNAVVDKLDTPQPSPTQPDNSFSSTNAKTGNDTNAPKVLSQPTYKYRKPTNEEERLEKDRNDFKKMNIYHIDDAQALGLVDDDIHRMQRILDVISPDYFNLSYNNPNGATRPYCRIIALINTKKNSQLRKVFITTSSYHIGEQIDGHTFHAEEVLAEELYRQYHDDENVVEPSKDKNGINTIKILKMLIDIAPCCRNRYEGHNCRELFKNYKTLTGTDIKIKIDCVKTVYNCDLPPKGKGTKVRSNDNSCLELDPSDLANLHECKYIDIDTRNFITLEFDKQRIVNYKLIIKRLLDISNQTTLSEKAKNFITILQDKKDDDKFQHNFALLCVRNIIEPLTIKRLLGFTNSEDIDGVKELINLYQEHRPIANNLDCSTLLSDSLKRGSSDELVEYLEEKKKQLSLIKYFEYLVNVNPNDAYQKTNPITPLITILNEETNNSKKLEILGIYLDQLCSLFNELAKLDPIVYCIQLYELLIKDFPLHVALEIKDFKIIDRYFTALKKAADLVISYQSYVDILFMENTKDYSKETSLHKALESSSEIAKFYFKELREAKERIKKTDAEYIDYLLRIPLTEDSHPLRKENAGNFELYLEELLYSLCLLAKNENEDKIQELVQLVGEFLNNKEKPAFKPKDNLAFLLKKLNIEMGSEKNFEHLKKLEYLRKMLSDLQITNNVYDQKTRKEPGINRIKERQRFKQSTGNNNSIAFIVRVDNHPEKLADLVTDKGSIDENSKVTPAFLAPAKPLVLTPKKGSSSKATLTSSMGLFDSTTDQNIGKGDCQRSANSDKQMNM